MLTEQASRNLLKYIKTGNKICTTLHLFSALQGTGTAASTGPGLGLNRNHLNSKPETEHEPELNL
jgi:hypothetical protein